MNSETCKSRTKLKIEAKELQKLGESLTEMSEDTLRDLSLPDNLYRALIETKSIKTHEARRRHLQFIGSLMRRLDAGDIRQKLQEAENNKQLISARHRQIEKWRELLLTGDTSVLTRILNSFPSADGQYIGQLTRNAKREMAADKPKKSSRILFAYLKELADSVPDEIKDE